MTIHPFDPVYDTESHILILGSFPSVKSREILFFYGHPQNRFWKVIAAVTEDDAFARLLEKDESGASIEDKKAFLLRNHIALWDVIASCEITGSSDASIKNAAPNDINRILKAAPIRAVFCNGNKAAELYERFLLPVTGRDAVRLPSTSPANAAWTLPRLVEEWKSRITATLN